MKNKLLFVAGFIICFCLLGIYLLKPSKQLKYDNTEGNIIYHQTDAVENDITFDEEWIAADAELGDNYMIAINDPDECLSQSGFLTVKGHMTKCEAIYDYLKEFGYEEKSVTVLSDTVIHNGNNAYFCVSLDSYPDTILEIAFYGISEEFAFSLKK